MFIEGDVAAEPMIDRQEVRLLQIKTSVLKRNMIELVSYQAEETVLKQKLQSMITQGADECQLAN